MRSFIVLLVLVLVSGCATEAPRPIPKHPGRIWARHRRRMQAVTHFTLSAQAGIRAARRGGSLMLRWVLMPQAYQMSGYGPFGRLVFRLRVNRQGAKLVSARGRFSGPSPSALLTRLTGLRLPVAGLRFWILGVPTPGVVTRQRISPWGLLTRLQQNGWFIRYRRYDRTPWGRLPRLLTLTRKAGPRGAPTLIVTIRIDRWQSA